MNYKQTLKAIGCDYIGGTQHSAKMNYSFNNGCMTYGLYLAPANLSKYNVCPCSKYCKDDCLNTSGRNKISILAAQKNNQEQSTITAACIRKTNFLFEHTADFVDAMKHEIDKYMKEAEAKGMQFAVRLNCTSDISPEFFKDSYGLNLMEAYPDIQFYDYTKVPSRFNLLNKYDNYDLTFSYDGHNWNTCEQFINQYNGRVAVVFMGRLPKLYRGYKVIDGNGYDMRFMDTGKCIIGLHYHSTAKDYVNGKYVKPTNSTFIVDPDKDENCED